MYIICPECKTKFLITTEEIGQQGKRVRCSKCMHIWHQKLDDNHEIEPKASTNIAPAVFGTGVNLPALLPVKIPTYLHTIPFIMIALIVFMLVMIFPNNFGVSKMLNNTDLAIRDVRVENNADNKKIIISYKIQNNSAKKVKVPLVRVRVLGRNSQVIHSSVDDYSSTEIVPKEYIEIATEFALVDEDIGNIDIMIGNKIDFILND